MPFNISQGIRYYQFESISDQQVVHAVFTRIGGISPEPWDTLNVGGLVGDDPERVIENRNRAFESIGRRPGSIYDVWQVHGRDIVCSTRPRPIDRTHLKADAILTDQAGVTLFMRFADCVPIILYDPFKGVVGLVHAGWQGTVIRVISETIRVMETNYKSRAQDIRAAIGPAICARHYEVGAEVVLQVKRSFGADSTGLLNDGNGKLDPGKAYFDLWEANRLLLEQAGVRRIEMSGICTACHLEDWYSHRGENGQTGRFGVLIGLAT